MRGTWGGMLHPEPPGSLAHPKGSAGALHRHGSQQPQKELVPSSQQLEGLQLLAAGAL